MTSSEQYAAIIHDNAMMSLMKDKDAELFEQNIYKAIELKYKLYGISTDYFGSVSIVRGLRIQLSKDSRHSEQEEGKVLHTSYLCSEAFHLRVERLC